jgi:hypothetical protein
MIHLHVYKKESTKRAKDERKGRKGKYFLTTLRGGGVMIGQHLYPGGLFFISGSGEASGSGSDSLWHWRRFGGARNLHGTAWCGMPVRSTGRQTGRRVHSAYNSPFSLLLLPHLSTSLYLSTINKQTNRQTGRRVHSACNSPFLLLLSRHPFSLHTHTPHSTPQPAHRSPHSAQRAPARPYSARP